MHISSIKSIIFTASLTATVTAWGDPLTQWTFEPPFTDVTDSVSISGIVPTFGSGSASGLHASNMTDWSTPAGNGSTDSFSSNNWGVGDYYQFQSSSIGASGLSLSFDQISSNTGPGSFQLAYSTDGSTFTNSGAAYTVIANAGSNVWSSTAPITTSSFSFDLSGITALDNQPNIFFRLVDASTVSANGATVATAGTSRVDNFVISAVTVPEPGALAALLGGAAFLGLIRGRRS